MNYRLQGNGHTKIYKIGCVYEVKEIWWSYFVKQSIHIIFIFYCNSKTNKQKKTIPFSSTHCRLKVHVDIFKREKVAHSMNEFWSSALQTLNNCVRIHAGEVRHCGESLQR